MTAPLSLKNQTEGVKLGNLSLHSLLCADDLAILADNITDMQRELEIYLTGVQHGVYRLIQTSLPSYTFS